MAYQIRFLKHAEKELRGIPRADQKRVLRQIEALAVVPRPSGSKELRGELEGKTRIRIGTYRVVYEIQENAFVVVILRIAHRRDVYR